MTATADRLSPKPLPPVVTAACANCHRAVFLGRSGTWYHRYTGSVSCVPGSGARGRLATPGAHR